jgi:hypothetical protein
LVHNTAGRTVATFVSAATGGGDNFIGVANGVTLCSGAVCKHHCECNKAYSAKHKDATHTKNASLHSKARKQWCWRHVVGNVSGKEVTKIVLPF